MLRRRTLVYLSLAVFAFACSKEGLQIGREDPEKEIQKCVKLSQKKHYDEAVECLEIFKSRFPNTPEGQEAGLRIADTYFAQKQYLLAAEAYLNFTKAQPLHPKTEYAYYRAGVSYLGEAPKTIDRDQQYLFKAKETLQKANRVSYEGTYKDLILQTLKEIDEKLSERLFYVARFYYRTGEYLSAVPRLEELLEKYPAVAVKPKALFYLYQSYAKLGQKEAAANALQNLAQDFPNDPWTKKVRKQYDSTIVR